MPQPRKPKLAASKAASLPTLPPVSVLHFEHAMAIVEALVGEQTDLFIAAGQDYRRRHREGTGRPLNAMEAAQLTAATADTAGLPPITLTVAYQESDLRAYDEPEPMEILLRSGIATAPAAMESAKRLVALIEMPKDLLIASEDGGTLDADLDATVAEMRGEDLTVARERANRAFAHFAVAAGASPGKTGGLILKAVMQAVDQATSALGLQRGPSSLTGSLPSTDGLAETSSELPTS